MAAKPLSNPEIRREGFRALLDRLGPADTLRFIQQFDSGYGDYTQGREDLLRGMTIDDLVRELDARRTAG